MGRAMGQGSVGGFEGAAPAKVMGQCDVAALQRNSEFGRKYRINGTPGIVFEGGKRIAKRCSKKTDTTTTPAE